MGTYNREICWAISNKTFAKFKICIVVEKLEFFKSLCLDVSTRWWNSTYLMLQTAQQQYKKSFDGFFEEDTFIMRTPFLELCG